MQTSVHIRRLCGIGQLAAAFIAAALLLTWAQDQAPLPSVSGNLTVLNLQQDQNLSLHVQAQIVQQGVLLVSAGTVLADVPELGSVVFEVTALELTRLEHNGLIVATEAAITAVDRAKGLTLEVTLYDEDPAVAAQVTADYHHPFPAGDCVTRLRIGGTEYEAPWLRLLHSNLEVKTATSQPMP